MSIQHQPLYQTEPVRNALGAFLRPGGQILTHHMLDLVQPDPEALVVDVGCGRGGGLGILQDAGLKRVVGLDRDTALLLEGRQEGHTVLGGDMAVLPMSNEVADLVVCECAWNLGPKQETLAEFFRVLRPGGILALSDIFLRHSFEENLTEEEQKESGVEQEEKQAWPRCSCFFQASGINMVRKMVSTAGFTIKIVDDCTTLLRQTAAEFVFAHGSLHGFWQAVLGDSLQADRACAAAAASRPGLFLLIAIKPQTYAKSGL